MSTTFPEALNRQASKLSDETRSVLDTRRLLGLGLLTFVSWLVIWVGRNQVSKVVLDYYFELPTRPYFVFSDVLRLYIGTPLIVLAGMLTWLLPGIFLAILVGKSRRLTEIVIYAFGFSYLFYIIITWAINLIFVAKPNLDLFLNGFIVLGLFGWISLAILVVNKKTRFWPLVSPSDTRRLIWTIAIPIAAVVMLFPVLFWQDMQGDGVEIFELGRSLSYSMVPRFPSPESVAGLGIGMTPMAFPVHWFIVLFGEVEAAARLPMILYLSVLFCLLIELVEFQLPKRMELIEESLMVLAIGIVVVTLSYNASYDPYFSDIASPMAIDFLETIAILAAIYCLWRQDWVFVTVWVMVAFFGRPTGFLFLGLMLLSGFIAFPDKRKQWLPGLSALLICCIIIGFISDQVILPMISGSSNFGYPTISIIDRVRYIRIFEWQRIFFLTVPVGILPFFCLFFFKWQDSYSRFIAVITLCYSLFFLFVAFVALHHFFPVMILPLVVFWRMIISHPGWSKNYLYPVITILGIVSLVLSMPRNFTVNRTARSIGQKTTIGVGSYENDYSNMINHTDLIAKLIRPDWFVADPASELVSTPLALIFYATRPKLPNQEINYLIQELDQPVQPGFSLVANDQTAGFYVRDNTEWRSDRFQRWNVNYQSPLYRISRGTLYYYRVITEGTVVIDLIQLAGKIKHRLFDR